MGAGRKEVSLEAFETHLKKLLHIIDKLPRSERDKAVLILKNSANYYSSLSGCDTAVVGARDEDGEGGCSSHLQDYQQQQQNQQQHQQEHQQEQQQPHQQQQQQLQQGQQQQEHSSQHLAGSESVTAQPSPAAERVRPGDLEVARGSFGGCHSAEFDGCNAPEKSSIAYSNTGASTAATQNIFNNEAMQTVSVEGIRTNRRCEGEEEEEKGGGEDNIGMAIIQDTSDIGMESQAILEEIGGLGGGEAGDNQDSFLEDNEDCWDEHVLQLNSPATTTTKDSASKFAEFPSPKNMVAKYSLSPANSHRHTDFPPASSSSSTTVNSLNLVNSSSYPSNPQSAVISDPQSGSVGPMAPPVHQKDTLVASSKAGLNHVNADHHPRDANQSDPDPSGFRMVEPDLSKSRLSTVVKPDDDGHHSQDSCGYCGGKEGGYGGSGSVDTQVMTSCPGCRLKFCSNKCFPAHSDTCSNSKTTEQALETSVKKLKGKRVKRADKPEYKCVECMQTFLTALTLHVHVLGHSNNNCDKCDAKFAKRKKLVAHLKAVHFIKTAEKYYHCKFCTRTFVKKPSLYLHYKIHARGTQAVCIKCGEILDSPEDLTVHMRNHKAKTAFNCDRCGEFFARKQQYDVHMENHDKYKCVKCHKSFSSKKRLKAHKAEEHANEKKPADVADMKQEQPVTIERRTPLQERQVPDFVPPAQSYPRAVPTAAFKKESVAVSSTVAKKEEVYYQNSRGKYNCKYCNFEHTRASRVVKHANCHLNYKKFVCELCGSAFNTLFTLKEHRIYLHSEERKYVCTKCNKTFKAKNNLIRHEFAVHNDKRAFKCECGKSYKRGSHLRRHLISNSCSDPMAAVDKREPKTKPVLPTYSNPQMNWNVESIPDRQKIPTSLADFGIVSSIATRKPYKVDLDAKYSSASLSGSAALAVVSSLDFSPKSEKLGPKKCDCDKEELESYDKLKPYRIPRNITKHVPTATKYPGYPPEEERGPREDLIAHADEAQEDLAKMGSSSSGRGYAPSIQATSSRHYTTSESHYNKGYVSPTSATGYHVNTSYHTASSFQPQRCYSSSQPQYQEKVYLSPPPERLSSLDKLQGQYSDKHYLLESDREYSYDKYGLGHDKLDYSLPLNDKNYPEFLSPEKNYLVPGGSLDDKQYSQTMSGDKSAGPAASTSTSSYLPLDERLFQPVLRDPGYSQAVDPRFLSSLPISPDPRPDSLFMDSGPADLTMTPKDIAVSLRPETRNDMSLSSIYTSPVRHNQYRPRQPPLHTQRGSGQEPSSRSHHFMSQDPGAGGSRAHHYVSPRSGGGCTPGQSDLQFRTGGGGSDGGRLVDSGLDDPTYKSLHDSAGFPPLRQASNTHYYDQIDAYLHPNRSLDIDDGYDKRHKYYKPEKYYRQEDAGGGSGMSSKQEGTVLPPLLALAPSSSGHHSGQASHSPPNMKLDYMCSTADTLPPQYLPDTDMDYY